jgi:hypothetical protein
MEEPLMSNIELLNERFEGRRPPESGKHHTWEKLFIRVKPPDNT